MSIYDRDSIGLSTIFFGQNFVPASILASTFFGIWTKTPMIPAQVRTILPESWRVTRTSASSGSVGVCCTPLIIISRRLPWSPSAAEAVWSGAPYVPCPCLDSIRCRILHTWASFGSSGVVSSNTFEMNEGVVSFEYFNASKRPSSHANLSALG